MVKAVGDEAGMSAVDTYLAGIDAPMREALQHMRRTVLDLVPGAEEVIAYGIPTVRLNGRNLVHFAAFKKHCSFFPGAIVEAEMFREELAGYKVSKGTIQFTPDKPLPDDLVGRIVRMRIEDERRAGENAGRKRPRG